MDTAVPASNAGKRGESFFFNIATRSLDSSVFLVISPCPVFVRSGLITQWWRYAISIIGKIDEFLVFCNRLDSFLQLCISEVRAEINESSIQICPQGISLHFVFETERGKKRNLLDTGISRMDDRMFRMASCWKESIQKYGENHGNRKLMSSSRFHCRCPPRTNKFIEFYGTGIHRALCVLPNFLHSGARSTEAYRSRKDFSNDFPTATNIL